MSATDVAIHAPVRRTLIRYRTMVIRIQERETQNCKEKQEWDKQALFVHSTLLAGWDLKTNNLTILSQAISMHKFYHLSSEYSHTHCGSSNHISHPYQVVSRYPEDKPPADTGCPTMPGFPQKGYGLQPPENLFDPCPFSLTNRVSLIPHGVSCDRRWHLLYSCCLSDMRSHVETLVLCLVTAKRLFPGNPPRMSTAACRSALPEAFVMRALTVRPFRFFHQRVSQVAQLRFLAFGFLVQSCIHIRSGIRGLHSSFFHL